MKTTRLALGLLPFLLVPFDGAAQTSSLEPGQRVRVTAPELGLDDAERVLSAVDSEALTFDGTRVPLASITELELFTGRRARGPFKWGGIGLLTGALIGGVVGAIVIEDDDIGSFPDVDFAAGAYYGAAPGALLGVLFGLTHTDRWESVPVGFSVAPRPEGGISLGLSVVF